MFTITPFSFTYAKPAQSVTQKKAKKYYKQGETHFRFGEYQKALRVLNKSYRLDPKPSLLYNIAECHRHLENYEQALSFYELYLEKEPSPENLAKVKSYIKTIKAALKD